MTIFSSLCMEIKIDYQATQSFERGFEKDITGSTSKIERYFLFNTNKYIWIFNKQIRNKLYEK